MKYTCIRSCNVALPQVSKSEYAADDVGCLLQARIASQAVCVRDYIWLIGGWDPGSKGDGGEILNDIWRLDLNTWMWTETSVQVEDSYGTLTFILGLYVLACEAALLHSCQHYITMWYCQVCIHALNAFLSLVTYVQFRVAPRTRSFSGNQFTSNNMSRHVALRFGYMQKWLHSLMSNF